MDTQNPWQLIKAGFWLGIGFIVPTIIVYLIGMLVVFAVPSLMSSSQFDDDIVADAKETVDKMVAEHDKTNQIRIVNYREVKNGNQVFILGSVENTGADTVGSIQLEAELLDDAKQMVFECSQYISKKLKQGETENFQIKCGCGHERIPEHKSVNVRVVSASNF